MFFFEKCGFCAKSQGLGIVCIAATRFGEKWDGALCPLKSEPVFEVLSAFFARISGRANTNYLVESLRFCPSRSKLHEKHKGRFEQLPHILDLPLWINNLGAR